MKKINVNQYRNIINGILFQLIWLSVIKGFTLLGLALLSVMFIHYLFYLLRDADRIVAANLLFCLKVAVVGITVDTLYTLSSFYSFPSYEHHQLGVIPSWLCMLWVGFSLTLTMSLHFIVVKERLFKILCTIFGPLSYLAAREYGAIDFSNAVLLFIAIEWLVIGAVIIYFDALRVRSLS